jgi:hypothetical protein
LLSIIYNNLYFLLYGLVFLIITFFKSVLIDYYPNTFYSIWLDDTEKIKVSSNKTFFWLSLLGNTLPFLFFFSYIGPIFFCPFIFINPQVSPLAPFFTSLQLIFIVIFLHMFLYRLYIMYIVSDSCNNVELRIFVIIFSYCFSLLFCYYLSTGVVGMEVLQLPFIHEFQEALIGYS